jgi:hypothetical protein
MEIESGNTASDLPKQAGLVLAMFDLPFSILLPNGAYRCVDPVKGMGLIEVISREGCISFFRDRPLVQGPTSFAALEQSAKPFTKPRLEMRHSFTTKAEGREERAVVNLNSRKRFFGSKILY